jgi:hypothetical protein
MLEAPMAKRIRVTQKIRTGSYRVRCVCGRTISPGTTHTCTKTY